jgi:hypothetical protein
MVQLRFVDVTQFLHPTYGSVKQRILISQDASAANQSDPRLADPSDQRRRNRNLIATGLRTSQVAAGELNARHYETHSARRLPRQVEQ